MALLKGEPKNSIDYPTIPEGDWEARLIGIIDLGTVYSEQWQKDKHKMRMLWEIPGVYYQVTDEETGEVHTRSAVINDMVTMSFHNKSKFIDRYKKWGAANGSLTKAGKDFHQFETDKALGQWALLTVEHNDNPNDPSNPYVNIALVRELKTEPKDESRSEPFEFLFKTSTELPERIGKKTLERIMGSQEWPGWALENGYDQETGIKIGNSNG